MDFSRNVSGIVDELDLEKAYDKSIIKFRFLNEISFYEQKRDHTKKYYNAFRFIVTTGSILLPAILSMGQMDPTKLPANFDMISYWASWMISLMVTASNGFLQLFSLDKNYFSYSMVVEQLKTEGWQFFGLSGKYEDYDSHQEAYKVFSKSIESIKRKQMTLVESASWPDACAKLASAIFKSRTATVGPTPPGTSTRTCPNTPTTHVVSTDRLPDC